MLLFLLNILLNGTPCISNVKIRLVLNSDLSITSFVCTFSIYFVTWCWYKICIWSSAISWQFPIRTSIFFVLKRNIGCTFWNSWKCLNNCKLVGFFVFFFCNQNRYMVKWSLRITIDYAGSSRGTPALFTRKMKLFVQVVKIF